MSNFQQDRCKLQRVGQTAPLWVDVYDACNYSGNRRRFFAPAQIDRAMFDRAEHPAVRSTERSRVSLAASISVRLGSAGVRFRVRRADGRATELCGDVPALDLHDAVCIEIVAPASAAPRAAAA